MRMNPPSLAAVLVASLACSSAFAAAPGRSGRLYGSVRASHGTAVVKVLFSRGFASGLPKAQQDILGSLKGVNLNDPDSRQAVAPIMHELVAGETPAAFFERFATLDPAEQERLARAAFTQAIRTTSAKAAVLSLRVSITGAQEETGLRETEAGLRELVTTYSLYFDKKALDSLKADHKAAMARLKELVESRIGRIVSETTRDWRRPAMDEVAGTPGEYRRETDKARDTTPAGPRTALEPTPQVFDDQARKDRPNPRVERTREMVRKLRASPDIPWKMEVVREMEGFASRNTGTDAQGRPVGAAIHGIIVKSLVEDLWASGSLFYSRHLASALARIARSSPYPETRELVVRALREDKRRNDDPDHVRSVEDLIDRLTHRDLPSIVRRELAARDQGPGPGYLQQLIEGIRKNPLGALLNLVGLIASAFLVSQASFGWLGALALGIAMLTVSASGLFRKHWAPNVFQLFLIGSFWHDATLLPNMASLIALIPMTALWGAIATYSYRFDKPVLGWALNWALVYVVGFLLTGSPVGFSLLGAFIVGVTLAWQRQGGTPPAE